jgi:hypothetical protein
VQTVYETVIVADDPFVRECEAQGGAYARGTCWLPDGSTRTRSQGFGAIDPATPLPTGSAADDYFIAFCQEQGMPGEDITCGPAGDCGIRADGKTMWCKTPKGIFEGKPGEPIARLGQQTLPVGWLVAGAAAVLYFVLKR